MVALDVIGLTLLALYLLSRAKNPPSGATSNLEPPTLIPFRKLVFPICYFFVAVPWPTVIEWPLIQSLTQGNVGVVIELLNWTGVPAVQHGNTIEISTGVVGIDEACSGIRSFQATLMISLFLGDLYRLSLGRRSALCFSGFLLAFVFNVGRTFLLVQVASRKGVAAIAQWHDPAGVTILVACFVCLWLAALAMRQRADETPLEVSKPAPSPAALETPAVLADVETRSLKLQTGTGRPPSTPSSFFVCYSWPLAFGAWLVLVEVGVETWYRAHETRTTPRGNWTVTLPKDRQAYREIRLPEATRNTLRYTEAICGAWMESDRSIWQAVFLRWAPGRVAAHLARGHTPDLCLPASGYKLLSASSIQKIPVHGLLLPFRTYVVQERARVGHVFYCLWQDNLDTQQLESDEILSWGSRLANVRAGKRNLGQRSLELVVWGLSDERQAEAAFHQQLNQLVRVDAAPASQPAGHDSMAR
jgi:exosortase/archaeosortase family protein